MDDTRQAEKSHKSPKHEMDIVDVEKDTEVDDPWALPDTIDTGKQWNEMTGQEKLKRVVINILKVVLLLGLLYMFICSLDFLSSAFRLLGGKAAGEALSDVELLSNPVAGLMVGVLATVLVQSSSTSTSIIVSMVSADMLPTRLAIPIIMGTNIGTTITNVLVSLGQIGDRDRFRRAFGGATLHDMFNWLTVLVLLPIEVASGYLYRLSGLMVQNINADPNVENPDLLKAVTKPLTGKIIELDNDVIRAIARGDNTTHTLIKFCCEKGEHLFLETSLSDTEVGLILLAMALVTLCTCLVLIVKILQSLLKGAIAKVIRKIVNADLPGILRPITGYVVMLVGAGLTFLVQSSSIFTSTLTPLVGMGVIKVDRVFPLVLGANIGTTFTSILAALASDSTGFRNSLQVSFCHLLFNISGISLWYGIWPARQVPIRMAKKLGSVTADYRWFPIFYIFFVFLFSPMAVFGLSLAGWEYLVGFGVPVLILVIFVITMNLLQSSDRIRPRLPHRLQSFENMGLPLCLRSLQPYDKAVTKLQVLCSCCKCCKLKTKEDVTEDKAERVNYDNKAFEGERL
ncbi:sodium-dependent phosphate transport protein 2B-like [Haliotis rubra]|uniref:sodium-dependent phosphate transport protein 2B-like n=1 Tax=Haliotis rubra TaxID=36100 RepID=UPI001EE60AB1|nr:sodium-dependent phosphate transport protein 2B-like [Haliotis rubra]